MTPSRRRLLGAVGTAGLAGTAGCLGLGLFGPSLPDCSGDGVARVDPPVRGSGSAPVRVVAYTDYGCPHCETYVRTVAPRLDDRITGGDVLYLHRDYPIPASGRSFPVANAARAVQDAAGDAAFWTYYGRLFANQGEYGLDRLVAYADGLDVAGERIRTAVDELRYCEAIKAERATGSEVGVEGTPSVTVDGDLYEAPSGDDLERAVEDAL